MSRKRKSGSPFRLIVLVALVAGAVYINQVVVPVTPPLFIATPTPTRAPESFLIEAEDLISKGKINQAITTYQEAVKADPNNPGVYVTLARWQIFQGDLTGAMDNVQNALLLNQNHALAHAVRGWILAKEKDFLAAEAELKSAIELDQNSALAYAFLAELYVDKLMTDQADLNTQNRAIEYSRKARDLDPSLLEVHRVRGLVLENTNQSEEAIKEFQAAIAINQNLADLYISLGRNYKLAGQYDSSVEALMKAIALRPDDSAPYAELAATYLTAGEFTKGSQIAGQAVQRSPEDPYLHGLLGTMYYKLARANESTATQYYGQSLPELRLSVKGGMTDKGEKVEPLPLARDDLSSVFYRLRYGIALAKLGQCGEAVSVAQELNQALPGDPNVAENLPEMLDTCKQQIDGTPTPSPQPAPGKIP